MTYHKDAVACPFEARVAFCCERTIFAIERYCLAAPDEYEAERIARERAAQSPYHNSRIPDLAIDVDIIPVDGPQPDDDPEGPGARSARPVCKACGSDDLTCDAVTRWDDATQRWSLSSTFDDIVCGACGREGSDIICWLAFDPSPLTLGSHVAMVPVWGRDAAALDGRAGVIHEFSGWAAHVRVGLPPAQTAGDVLPGIMQEYAIPHLLALSRSHLCPATLTVSAPQ